MSTRLCWVVTLGLALGSCSDRGGEQGAREEDGGRAAPDQGDGGSHEPSGSGDPSTDGGRRPPTLLEPAGVCPEAGAGGSCDGPVLNTSHALAISVDVWWDRHLMAAGRGEVTLLLLGDLSGLCEADQEPDMALRLCAVRFPTAVADEMCEAYQMQVPDRVWDRDPGVQFHAPVQLGAPDPQVVLRLLTTQAGWGVEAGRLGDLDGDGRDGITVRYRDDGSVYPHRERCTGGQPFRYAPMLAAVDLTTGPTYGAPTLHAGLATQLGGEVSVARSCLRADGRGAVSSVERKVWSCLLEDGSDCNGQELEFVRDALPKYRVLSAGEAPPPELSRPFGWDPVDATPSPGPLLQMKHLLPSEQPTSCQDVREAFL